MWELLPAYDLNYVYRLGDDGLLNPGYKQILANRVDPEKLAAAKGGNYPNADKELLAEFRKVYEEQKIASDAVNARLGIYDATGKLQPQNLESFLEQSITNGVKLNDSQKLVLKQYAKEKGISVSAELLALESALKTPKTENKILQWVRKTKDRLLSKKPPANEQGQAPKKEENPVTSTAERKPVNPVEETISPKGMGNIGEESIPASTPLLTKEISTAGEVVEKSWLHKHGGKLALGVAAIAAVGGWVAHTRNRQRASEHTAEHSGNINR
jgi:hypothetical protein